MLEDPMKQNVLQPLDKAEFRNVVGHFASGVTIVTAAHDGVPYGATISAVTSLCDTPPMVLVCLNQKLGTHAAIRKARHFTINILGEDQASLAHTFATPGADKFADVAVHHRQHGPRLAEALAYLTCRVVDDLEGGTHRIFVAEVVEAQAGTGNPLSYYRGRFGHFVPYRNAMWRTTQADNAVSPH
ncbi:MULTISPECIES: 4-nitrophenol 4-monooxygenase/4-nitrocatechol 2-monooxygenaser reductase component [Rhodococcus]|uniref:4-nitrophenol 4-monooxygenase/4-nitrocatechol 2-monooxygenase, reductase component n=3 Tax=Rhodococcus TaxID=1827 RepID=NPCB_RHOOP|nr:MULTISPECIES: 4-nitrophenol 4-monooxygenase/4-nitrocatechol 2-monooxygenaser reductase component [Rhodococcus]Q6F4M9.1 RecName: Full=4-nitrophenol 4-monooxygenase/4-nitrocatechol 2-monooxygenase, reductase component; Short=4-NP/4-NCA monooxygenase; AltName: Full=PNP monooxygenase [Rhodococcus opacus]QQZ16886.1 flavin reductase family protein [Rhodococcus sp. 21391]BAD30041.1 reductase component of 4-nitrophenol monooxygenase [Rhodococcus opacus]BAI48078.1 NADH/FAD oxidoreductase [Rhodococcus